MEVVKLMPVNAELDIQGITLLSDEEFDDAEDNIPPIHAAWWLRSASDWEAITSFVDTDGYAVNVIDLYVCASFGVRPALKLSNLETSQFQIGDRFEFADESWTVISDRYALCDSIVGDSPYRDDYNAHNAGCYGQSDVKAWLEKWAEEKSVPFEGAA